MDHAQGLIHNAQVRDAIVDPAGALNSLPQWTSVAAPADDLAILDASLPGNTGLPRTALLVLLGLIVVGTAAAVVFRKRDPKVYTGLDVERVVGTAPMAVLPDFSEVPDEVAETHLMRLVSVILSAGKGPSPKNCIFTAIDSGAGTTTVATRVKNLLGTMGNAPLVVDASQASATAGGEGASWEQRVEQQGGVAGALLQLAGDGAHGHEGQMVLADAAPLAISADTEFLVGHADCAIVIIESGGSTRAQLRNAASLLQRLKAPAAGFVLNRVKLAKADRAFRHSVEEMTRSVRDRSQLVERQTLETLRFAVESGRASLDPEIGLSAEPLDHGGAERVAFAGAAVQPAPSGAQPAQKFAGNDSSTSAGTERALEETPWWLGEAPTHSSAPRRQEEIPRVARRWPAAGADDGKDIAEEATKTAANGNAPARLPRLTELRGTMFSTGIKELDQARHGAEQSGAAERLTGAIAPLEALLGGAQRWQNAVQPHVARVKALLPAPKPEAAPTAMDESGVQHDAPQAAAAQPTVQPPKQKKAARSKQPQDAREPYDKVEILPSRRGQYKRKD